MNSLSPLNPCPLLSRKVVFTFLLLFIQTLSAQVTAPSQTGRAGGESKDIITVSGLIVDRQTHQPLAHVSVVGGQVGTVTNDQGRFSLKISPQTKTLTVSLIGYQSCNVNVEADGQELKIQMQPLAVTLNEIIVRSVSAGDIVRAAINRFNHNYSLNSTSYKGFYREVIQKRRQFLSISEAVVQLYKTPYDRNILFDAVSILRGRRMMNMKAKDTLAVKLRGGPTLPIFADVVKNDEFLFYEDDLSCYRYEYIGDERLDDRVHYVIRMIPDGDKPYALFFATLYIDKKSLAISRADLRLDMANRSKATSTMLIHRPSGLHFTPQELTFNIYYRTEDGVTYLNYVRNEMRFKCDWRRRLFASSFTVVSEFVVTDILHDAKPIRGRDSFRRNANLYDNVDFFSDPDFWGADNIIEPTEPLNRAVERLKRTLSNIR